jgi:glycine/D-amino acid oxidase-like deaminating enzyme
VKAHADVVVVGGGILGCGIAAELARGGAEVVLVERAQIAAGASGRNHGLIFLPEHPGVQPLAELSMDAYRELSRATPLDLALDGNPFGLVIVVSEEGQWAAAEREAMVAARSGCPVERLDEAGLQKVEPSLSEGHLGGFLIEDGYRVDPAALTLALAYDARASGAEICTFTDVKQVLAAGGKVRGVATDRGVVEAPIVVDAAGPWAARLARSASPDPAGLSGLPIGGVRGWLLLTEAQPGLMRHIVESAGWHLAAGDPGPGGVTVGDHAKGGGDRRDIGTLVQQNRGGQVLLGGSRAPSLAEEPEGADATAEIARRAAAEVPAQKRRPYRRRHRRGVVRRPADKPGRPPDHRLGPRHRGTVRRRRSRWAGRDAGSRQRPPRCPDAPRGGAVHRPGPLRPWPLRRRLTRRRSRRATSFCDLVFHAPHAHHVVDIAT